MGISPDEFEPPSKTARKLILITFIILLTTAKSGTPTTINARWLTSVLMWLIIGL